MLPAFAAALLAKAQLSPMLPPNNYRGTATLMGPQMTQAAAPVVKARHILRVRLVSAYAPVAAAVGTLPTHIMPMDRARP
jgi:hypothetical protein